MAMMRTVRPVSSTELGRLCGTQWADRQRANVNVSTSATHQCYPALLSWNRSRADALQLPRAGFLIVNKAWCARVQPRACGRLRNSPAMHGATSGEVRWGGRREAEPCAHLDRRLIPVPIQMRRGTGGYSGNFYKEQANKKRERDRERKKASPYPFMCPGVLVVLLQPAR